LTGTSAVRQTTKSKPTSKTHPDLFQTAENYLKEVGVLLPITKTTPTIKPASYFIYCSPEKPGALRLNCNNQNYFCY
jgi:hypothetical protein